MTDISADARNADQVAYWNGVGGQHWVTLQEDWDVVLGPVADAVLAAAAAQPGERVVDIGCGCGGTVVSLAAQVGARGHVLGIDLSAPMLARAAERLPRAAPVDLALADVTIYPFAPGRLDLLFSRFGVMFFADPTRAFTNLRTALRPGGRAAFACWRTPRENPWMMMPLQAAYAHVPPLPKLGPEDPGPFSFAAEERVHRILGDAGFGQIAMKPVDLELDLAVGRGLDAAVSAALQVGPASRAVDGQPAAAQKAAAEAIRTALAAHQRGETVPLAAAIWIVTASAA